MKLFSKKNKYGINAKYNRPQMVYGIPNAMLKKWKRQEEKINGKNLFSAFESGYLNPSYYYFVNKFKGSYQFRFGYSKDGEYVSNNINNTNLHIINQNKEYYNKFIDELLVEVKDWKETYKGNTVTNSIQWDINLIQKNKRYNGSNDFPDNYDKVVKILNKYFSTNQFIEEDKSNKYDIDVEDNIPREVYGIPNFMRNNDKNDIKVEDNVSQKIYDVSNNMPNSDFIKPIYDTMFMESIRIGVKNERNNYILLLNHTSSTKMYDLVFADLNNLDGKVISDLSTNIPEGYYSKFVNKLNDIIKDWKDNYSGESNIVWSIKFDTENNKGLISGNGGFPNNWNELIALLSEYEKIFKNKKKIDIEEIQKI